MKIKELHPDVEGYLSRNNNEVRLLLDRSFSSIFFADQECVKLCENDNDIACIVNQSIIVFESDGDRIVYSAALDATNNNVEIIKLMFENGGKAPSDRVFDEYNPGETARAKEAILSLLEAL